MGLGPELKRGQAGRLDRRRPGLVIWNGRRLGQLMHAAAQAHDEEALVLRSNEDEAETAEAQGQGDGWTCGRGEGSARRRRRGEAGSGGSAVEPVDGRAPWGVVVAAVA